MARPPAYRTKDTTSSKYEFESQTVVDRFSRGYLPLTNGCWKWQKSTGRNGYGVMGVGPHSIMTTHRISWLIWNGAIPDGLFVLHKCDNRWCVNPTHLYLGTVKDNSRDLWERGKPYAKIQEHKTPETERRRIAALPRGAKHHRAAAKLTAEVVVKILNSTGAQHVIAKKFGVCQQTVSLIKTKKRWTHIHG